MAYCRNVVEWFAAGALAMLLFHQGSVAVLSALGMFPVGPWNVARVPPFGLPALVHGAFFSGVWAVLYVLVLEPRRPADVPLWLAVPLFAAIVPVAFLFLVMAPARGAPLAFGMGGTMVGMVILAHAVWGLGIALLVLAFRRLVTPPRPRSHGSTAR